MVPDPPVLDPSPRGETRVPTGCPELDEMLRGGLVARRPYLLVGPSGTGKTSLALQFLCEGVRRGERALIVTLEEPPNEMRANHRALAPEIDQVYVFDAIPDVMRYERTPFKDIAAVRAAIPFEQVPLIIRQTPELASVEVTFTALEQMLKTEVARRGYSRLVIDSLTALEYFCMKGFDETLGAQTFLRFLSDLRVTTLLTVEAPLEDVDSPERLLARGEIRLFRWEHEGRTVRAIGVEKFRGSEHDVRLHPYRISSRGLAINLGVTISRDTREILTEPSPLRPPYPPAAAPVEDFPTLLSSIEEDTHDLLALGLDVLPVRRAIAEAVAATEAGQSLEASARLGHARAEILATLQRYRERTGAPLESAAARRLATRAAEARAGRSPTPIPDSDSARPALVGFLHRLDGILATGGSTGSREHPVKGDAEPTGASGRGPEVASPEALTPEASTPAHPAAPVDAAAPLAAPESPPPSAPASADLAPAGPVVAEVHVPAFDLAPPVETPPPLPQVLAATSEPPVAPPPRPFDPSVAGGPYSPAPTPSGPSGPPPLPMMTPPAVPEPAAPTGSAEAPLPPKRKRKAAGATTSRKRASSRTAAGPADAAEAAPGSPVPAPKPKRRTAARRKAPPVTAAEAGAPPPEEHRVAPADTPGPPDEPAASTPPAVAPVDRPPSPEPAAPSGSAGGADPAPVPDAEG